MVEPYHRKRIGQAQRIAEEVCRRWMIGRLLVRWASSGRGNRMLTEVTGNSYRGSDLSCYGEVFCDFHLMRLAGEMQHCHPDDDKPKCYQLGSSQRLLEEPYPNHRHERGAHP